MVAVIGWGDSSPCRTCVGQDHAGRGRHRAASLRPSIRAPGRGTGLQKLPEQSQLEKGRGRNKPMNPRACPLSSPVPPSAPRPQARGDGKHLSPQTRPESTRKNLKTASNRKDGKTLSGPGCAESHRARTPTTLGDPPAPRSRVRKWRGKHGSVPGRRGHHVQLPTSPDPLHGPPRP